jgi:hypothetical protein
MYRTKYTESQLCNFENLGSPTRRKEHRLRAFEERGDDAEKDNGSRSFIRSFIL